MTVPAAPIDHLAILEFLRDCSNTSLGDFFIARLNRDANMRKELHSLLDRMVENMAVVHLANFIRDHRPELLKVFAVPATNSPAELSPSPDPPAPPRRVESDDASSRRTTQRKTRPQPG